ncbi:MAG: hypothetical protein ACT4PP_10950 [Sporichthyaceae bacterium]
MISLRKRIGLGPIPAELTGPVVVRQFGGVVTGVFLGVMLTAMGAAILADPGASVEGGDGVGDRFFFGILVVPGWWALRRFFLRPRIEITADALAMHNAFSSVHLRWPEVSGAALTGGIEVRTVDGEPERAMVFGPALSTPFTSADRPAAVVALIRATASARGGGPVEGEDAYLADDLVAGAISSAPARRAAARTHRRTCPGWGELLAYALLWGAASVLSSAVA